MQYEAVLLRNNIYAVRPKGQLGTLGWSPKPWTVKFIKAKSEKEAIAKALKK